MYFAMRENSFPPSGGLKVTLEMAALFTAERPRLGSGAPIGTRPITSEPVAKLIAVRVWRFGSAPLPDVITSPEATVQGRAAGPEGSIRTTASCADCLLKKRRESVVARGRLIVKVDRRRIATLAEADQVIDFAGIHPVNDV